MKSIAHIRSYDQKIQTVEEHLLEVKELAEQYGEGIGIKHLAGLAGVLHDVGKYSNEFIDYILEAVQNPSAPPKRGSVDHSTAGGKLLYDFFHTPKKPYKALTAEIVGNAILSHHSYLQDFLTPELKSPYLRRVRDKELHEFSQTIHYFFQHVINEEDFLDYVHKASVELENLISNKSRENYEKEIMFLTKFIFSTLIDADRTNTRLFEENTREFPLNNQELFKRYYIKLINKVNSFQ